MDNNIEDLIYHLYELEIPLEKKLHIDDKITFGTEIEFYLRNFENYFFKGLLPEYLFQKGYQISALQFHDFDKWIYKLETSVDENFGYEINSPIMHDKIKFWNELVGILTCIKGYGAITNKNCGSHVHFGANYLKRNCDYYKTLIKLWVCYEPIIYKFYTGNDSNLRDKINKYAESINFIGLNTIDNINDWNQLMYYINGLLIDNVDNNMYIRNYGLNISNIISGDKDTIELRCPNGTLDPIIWQNNIRFFANLMMAIRNDKIDLDFLDYKFKTRNYNRDLNSFNNIHLKEPIELANMIFNNENDKYYFLKQYYKLDDIPKNKKLQKILYK